MNISEEELKKFKNLSRENEDSYINLQPIQRGGVLPPESKKVLLSFGDGYSLCDFCFSGRLDEIETPAVTEFLRLWARFVDMDVSMPTGSSREAKKIAIQQLAKRATPGKQPILVIDGLAHYSTYIAAESAGATTREVPHNGYPEFRLDVDGYAAEIDKANDESKNEVIGALLTHSDYLYGNVTDPALVGKICKKKGVPFIINGAYTVGILPFSGKTLGADIVTASGHKSMASSGPIGMLGCSEELFDVIFPRSTIEGNWSGRTFHHKISTVLGCPAVYGAPLATLMSSFPHVVERTKPERWQAELDNGRYLAASLERVSGVKALGITPRTHTLMQFETPAFEEVARKASKKGYFLYNELKARGIIGIFPGMVKSIKLNTYGLTREQVEHVATSFLDIARTHNIDVKI